MIYIILGSFYTNSVLLPFYVLFEVLKGLCERIVLNINNIFTRVQSISEIKNKNNKMSA
jgi:hypothetical protein